MKFWIIELDLYSVVSKREIKTSTSSIDIVQTDVTKSSTTKLPRSILLLHKQDERRVQALTRPYEVATKHVLDL